MTLFEALVAVAITALISALAFPALGRSVDTLALEGSAVTLAADLRAARAQALRTGRGVRFDAAADARGYGWSGGRQVALPARLRIALVPGSLGFYPDGSSTGARLALASGRARRVVEVEAGTGLVAR